MSKIIITEKQKQQFNLMLTVLRRIAKDYCTSDQLRRQPEKEYGLDFSEAIEYAYDNVQNEAKTAMKGEKFCKLCGGE